MEQVTRCHVSRYSSIRNLCCLFMGQYIYRAAPFRCIWHLQPQSMALQGNTALPPMPVTNLQSFAYHSKVAAEWLGSQVRSQISGLKTLLCLPTGESRPWDFDMRCSFSFQGCGDSAMQLLAISCHWRAVCIITLRYVINYDWVYEGLATRQHKMYIVCYVLDNCVSTNIAIILHTRFTVCFSMAWLSCHLFLMWSLLHQWENVANNSKLPFLWALKRSPLALTWLLLEFRQRTFL